MNDNISEKTKKIQWTAGSRLLKKNYESLRTVLYYKMLSLRLLILHTMNDSLMVSQLSEIEKAEFTEKRICTLQWPF